MRIIIDSLRSYYIAKLSKTTYIFEVCVVLAGGCEMQVCKLYMVNIKISCISRKILKIKQTCVCKRHHKCRAQVLSKKAVLYPSYAGRLGPRHVGAPANILAPVLTDISDFKFSPCSECSIPSFG